MTWLRSIPGINSCCKFCLQSTGSFFHDRSITLGSLIGVSSILELSRRSIRGRRAEPLKVKKPCKAKPWIFSLCSRDSIDVKSTTHNTPSLGQFLAVERRAANNDQRRNQSPNDYVPDEISLAQPIPQPNSLFVDGRVAPPQSSSLSGFETESGQSEGNDQGNNNGHGVPVLFSCMCGKDDINWVSILVCMHYVYLIFLLIVIHSFVFQYLMQFY